MCRVCCGGKQKEVGLFLLRVALAIVFIYAGWGKLMPNHAMTVGMFTNLGFAGPEFWAYFVGGLEVLGGLMLLFGVLVRYAAVWLSIIMVVAIFTAHRGGPVMGYFLPLAALGGCLALFGTGAGSWRVMKKECICPQHNGTSDKDCGGKCDSGKGGCGDKSGGDSCCKDMKK